MILGESWCDGYGVGGGAWPFLVGGVICLVNSDNERDSFLLNRFAVFFAVNILLRETGGV